ncbi:cellular myosin heavy chain type a [Fusarium albosuccineum]|uniref:Cellular myosin heavy chain type a n=1 Tax=Fusarium albosuccineum TaxID=1237068 RepID=A0A8H4LL25_9HYPO|nr:cellular myosin heavy chain type a [Fusarium albosuccineum]
MSSPSILDRISSPRQRLPGLHLRSPPPRAVSEYDLDDLEPRAEEPVFDQETPRPRLRRPVQVSSTASTRRSSSPPLWDNKRRYSDSPSRTRPKPIFAGPPPPIASSVLINQHSSRQSPSSNHSDSARGYGLLSPSRFGLGNSLVDPKPSDNHARLDSIWRSLQRRERALERDIQQLLDLQASGLVAGSTDGGSEREFDRDSDTTTGESTFYSTATSKSRMINSLHIPARSTPDGNVIPVRQPAPKKPRGLKSARVGLQRSMAALSELKAEEDAHLDTALAQRRDALAYLDKMSARRDDIYAELHALEDNEQEPLGQELRELGAEHEALDQDIRMLEEKLVGMRNRRRWVREKMEDVKNRREAGLSGYRAAGRDVDKEVRALMQRPPITPLDIDALGSGAKARSKENADSLRGTEFLQLRPERRTTEMARTWWQGEIGILESRKAQISEDRQALNEGSKVWSEVTGLVAEFETKLRELIKTGQDMSSDEESQQTAMRDQLREMDTVVQALEQRLQLAENKHWNLLICAIGAELEAFLEAKAVLKATFGTPDEPYTREESSGPNGSGANLEEISQDSHDVSHDESHDGSQDENRHQSQESHEESDNEVPADLLVSRIEDHDPEPPDSPQQQSVILRRDSSEGNDVPAEFLAEHRG